MKFSMHSRVSSNLAGPKLLGMDDTSSSIVGMGIDEFNLANESATGTALTCT